MKIKCKHWNKEIRGKIKETKEKSITEQYEDIEEPYYNFLYYKQRTRAGPRIFKSEIQRAIRDLKTTKFPGYDKIHSVVFKFIDKENIDINVKPFNRMSESEIIPHEW